MSEVLPVCSLPPPYQGYLGAHLAYLGSKISAEQLSSVSPGKHRPATPALFFLPTAVLSGPFHSPPPPPSHHPVPLGEEHDPSPWELLVRMHLGVMISLLLGKESSGALEPLGSNHRKATSQTLSHCESCIFGGDDHGGGLQLTPSEENLPQSKVCGLGLGHCYFTQARIGEAKGAQHHKGNANPNHRKLCNAC